MADGIIIKHPNGYTGILYGERSMVIKKDGKEVMHTGDRIINTAEELRKLLDGMPEFIKILLADKEE